MKLGRILAAQAIAALMTVSAAHAADWPTREIRWIVPLGAGGGADLVSRVVAEELGKRLGKNIVVENKPGASSIIGTKAIADAEPDGYTIGLFTNVHPVNVATGQPVSYDAEKDLAYLTLLITTPMQLLANPKREFKSVNDIIAYGKANPDKMMASSIGAGTPHHLMSEWLAARAGVKMTVVPYKSVPDALRAVMVGEADMTFMGVGANADELVTAGSLTRIAMTSATRVPNRPDTPTMVEQGQEGFVEVGWYGVIAPAKTPPEIQKRLGDELRAALASPEVQKRLQAGGATPTASSGEEFRALVQKDTEKFKRIMQTIKAAKN